MSDYIIKAADWAIDYKGESLFKGCEEIVRCRDCKHFEYCQFHRHSENKPNGFCAWGERRTDDN